MKIWLLRISLLFLILISCSIGYGEEADVENEILFRDEEWYCDISTVCESLRGEIPGVYEIRKGERILHMSFWRSGYIASANDAGYSLTITPDEDFFVAGHRIEKIKAYAIYGIRENKVVEDESLSRLIMAQYEFDVNSKNVNDVYDDLFEKMCEIYGQPFETSDVLDMYAVWHGANSTGVYINGSFSYLYLCYGKMDFHSDLSELIEIRNKELIADEESKEGL